MEGGISIKGTREGLVIVAYVRDHTIIVERWTRIRWRE